jgi:DNA-binding transcriptional MerR regulator
MRYRSIHEVSIAYEITPRTLRFYEDEGLLTASRDSGNRRRYSEPEVAQLKRILMFKRFGLSLEEIGQILKATEPHAISKLERRFTERGIVRLRQQCALLQAHLEEAERFIAS